MRQSTEPVNGDDLACRLGIDRSALEGMLEELVNRGKLRKMVQMNLKESRRKIAEGKLTHYGDVCAYIGTAESVVHYEIVPEK